MKINKKHVISLVLALAMVLSCMPGIALAAEAADTYDRPTGRSIVLNYDGYMEAAGKVWAEELLATLPATATKGGEGEYPITWPSAAEIESIVDPDALGYYAIPGAVDGTSNAVSITIQVWTKTNLLYNPSFEENTWNSAAGWYGGDWSYRSTSDTAKKTIVPTPVEGAFSFQIYTSASARTKAQIRYQDDTRAQALATAVKAEGDGQYAVSIYAMDSTSANETTFPYPEHTAPLAVAIDILASEGTTSAGYQFIGSSAYTHNEGTMVVSPNGTVLDEAGDKGYAIAEVDLNEPVWYPWLACNSNAEPNPTYLMERRPELYGDLCIPVEY